LGVCSAWYYYECFGTSNDFVNFLRNFRIFVNWSLMLVNAYPEIFLYELENLGEGLGFFLKNPCKLKIFQKRGALTP